MRIETPQPKLRAALTRCATFEDLPSDLLTAFFRSCQARQYAAGERLIEQGAVADSLLLLVEGRATAHLRRDSTSEAIATFGPNEIIGEMALVTGAPRTAEITADEDVIALALLADDFQLLARQHPALAVVLTRLIADRLGSGERDGLGDKQVDAYRIERCVGRGATAMVYKAEDLENNRTIALKMMSHRLAYEPGAIKRFHREADLLLEIQHERIARVYRRFPAFGTNFIVMQFCEGTTLEHVIEQQGPLPERRVRPLVGQLAQAVGHLHDARIVHRDLKPSNIMINGRGELHLTDFGLAKSGNRTITVTTATPQHAFIGTPYYMAPEQMRGAEASRATDIYAFGCVAYEMLAGRRPFESRTLLDLMDEKRDWVLPPRRAIGHGISCRMRRLLSSCLANAPGKRRRDLTDIARWAD